LPLGDDPLEAAVLHGVIFHLDGEALVSGEVAWALRAGPALQHSIPSEAKVIMQASGRVLLDHKWKRRPGNVFSSRLFSFPAGLRGYLEVAHVAIELKLLIDSISRGLVRRSAFGGHE